MQIVGGRRAFGLAHTSLASSPLSLGISHTSLGSSHVM
jgi:hypothetical protein